MRYLLGRVAGSSFSLLLLLALLFCLHGCAMSGAQRDGVVDMGTALNDIGMAVAANADALGIQNDKVLQAIELGNQATEDIRNSGGGTEDLVATAVVLGTSLLFGPKIARFAGMLAKAGAGLVANGRKKKDTPAS